MAEKKNIPEKPSDMRRLAEQKVAQFPKNTKVLSPEETQRVLHELSVHQIELEMQNEELRTSQSDLETARERYFDLYNLAPVGYVTVSEKGLILEANLTSATMLGVSPGALVKQLLSQFIFKADQDIYYLLWKQLLESNKPQSCELRMLKKDGTIFWAHLETAARQADDGTQVCRIVISDITGCRRTDEHVALMVEMLDSAPASITVHDSDGRFLYANRKTFDMHGYEAAEFMVLNLHDLDVPESETLIAERMQLIKERGEASFEVSHFHKNGMVIQMEVFVKTIEWQGTLAMLSVASDITERKRVEEALEELRRLFKSTLDGLSAHVAVIDDRGEIILTNKAYRDFAEGNEINPSLVSEGVNYLAVCDSTQGDEREDAVVFAQGIREVLSGKRPSFEFEYPCHSPDEQRWFIGRVTPVQDKGGRRVVVAHENITLRKLAEEAQLETSLRLQESVRAANVGLWDWDLATHCVHYSSEWKRQIGCADAEIGDTFEEWESRVHPEDLAPTLEKVREAIAGDSRRYQAEFRFRHKDGSYRWIVAQCSVLRAENGKAVRVVGSHIDLTEFRRVEEAMHESEARFRSYIEHSPYGVFVVDGQGRYVDVNPAAVRITGYSAGQITSMCVSDMLPPENPEVGLQHFQTLLETGESIGDMACRHADGSVRHWMVSATRVSPDRYLAFVEDITERKKAEEEKANLELQLLESQKMEAVGQLSGGISHDFNNLLSIINGYSQMLLMSSDLNSVDITRVEEIMKAGERAAGLTRQLLLFSRRHVIESRIIDLNAIISGMEKMLRRLIRENIIVTMDMGSDLRQIKADPGSIEQVIMNLVINASDAMPDGGTLTLETVNIKIDETSLADHPAVNAPGSYVMLSVSDTGCGMDEKVRAHIFEPFFTTKEVGKGTGLGLATVYGIVKQSNAYIDVQSELGKGTRFRIYFPKAVNEGVADEEKMVLESTPQGTETILLAEDEESIRLMLLNFLQSIGYTVIPAGNGKEALDMAKNHNGKIHLLLTDIVMPEMNGFELAKQVKNLMPEIKLLFMSGYAKATETWQMMKINDNLIDKPIDLYKMAVKLREILEGKR